MTRSCVRATNWTTDSARSSAPNRCSHRRTVTAPRADASLPPASAVAAASEISSTPRSAPACSIARRNSVSMRRSSTISPDTACNALSTVASSRSSRCSLMVWRGCGSRLPGQGADRPDRAAAPCLRLPKTGSSTCASFRCGARTRSNPVRTVETSGQLVRERFDVDEAVHAGRSDGLFVQSLASSSRPSRRAISAPTRRARLSKFSGQFAAHSRSLW